ncbi:MAG: PAS domain S-box protein [Candidatus Thermoplasmatota archaeon]|nr:PAS domain S-box protein [Candidatus Thermoplasmatota archaeon]
MTPLKKKESEEKYRIIAELSTDGIYIISSEGFEYVNSAFEKISGYRAEEVCSKDFSFWNIIHPDDIKLIEGREKARKEGKEIPPLYQFRIITKDGKTKYVEVNTVPLSEKKARVLGIMRDVTERREVVKKLMNSERKYRNIFDSANDAIFLMSRDVFIDCNRKTLEIFACRKENIVGHVPYEFSPKKQPDGKDSKEEVLRKIDAALEGKPQRFYWKHIRMDGTPFDAEVSLNKVDVNGTSFVQAIVRDISEQKEIEKKLHMAEENYRGIFENAVMGIYKSTPEGHHVLVNPALARIYGYDSPEDLVKGMTDITKQLYVDPDRRKSLISQLKEKGEVSNFESQVYRKDGSMIWISENAQAVRDVKNNICYLIGTVEDITKQRKAEESLKESEEKYRLLSENSQDIIYAINKNYELIFAAGNIEGVTGYTVDDVPDGDLRNVVFAVPPEDVEVIVNLSERAWEGEQDVRGEFRIIRKDGGIRWVEVHLSPLYNENGEIYGNQGVMRDVTERKKMEEEIKENEEKLRNFVESATVGIWCFGSKTPVDITLPEKKMIKEFFKAVCVECNETYARMMGTTKEKILGVKLSEIMPDTEENREYLAAFIRNGFRLSGGISHEINRKGEEKYFSNSLVGTIKNGKLIEAWGTQTDITDLRKMEEELKKSGIFTKIS